MSLEGAIGVLLTVSKSVSRLSLALVVLLVTEVVFPNYFWSRQIQSSKNKFQNVRHEVLHSIATLIGGKFIQYLFQVGIANQVIVLVVLNHNEEDTNQNTDTSATNLAPLHFWLRLLAEVSVYFVVFDAYFYIFHRLFHTRYLWFIHKSHHVSSTPNAIAGFSFNPMEGNFFGSFLPLYSMVLTYLFGGVLKSTLVGCGTLQLTQSLLIHSGYELVGSSHFENRFLSLFLTPTFHDRHHECPNCNFSGFFTWLDDLFGTADKDWRRKYSSWRRTNNRQEYAQGRGKVADKKTS